MELDFERAKQIMALKKSVEHLESRLGYKISGERLQTQDLGTLTLLHKVGDYKYIGLFFNGSNKVKLRCFSVRYQAHGNAQATWDFIEDPALDFNYYKDNLPDELVKMVLFNLDIIDVN